MVKILCPIIILFTLYGCSGQENSIYYKGREFTYQVKIIKDSIVLKKHIIKLKVTNNLWAKMMTGGQTGIKWIYEDVVDSTKNKSLSVSTGAIDKSDRVFIHPPRNAYMTFTEIIPMPDIYLPAEIGMSSEGVINIEKGFGNLNGKAIKQNTKITDKKEKVKLLGKTYQNIWVIQGENTNHLKDLGQYKVTYWFNKNYGFIFMKYEKPNTEIVELKLENVRD